MLKVLLVGCCGKMGAAVSENISKDSELEIVCGVDKSEVLLSYPVYSDFENIKIKPDVIIDFSHPSLLGSMLQYAKCNSVPVVIATTGYNDSQIELIKEASGVIPVFFTFNMSVGVNLLCSLAKKAASVLGDNFDIEIIEKHHNQKIDAPSGTAIMLANAINGVFDDKLGYEYDRHSKRAKRSNREIGIHSVRAGTIVGEHDVIFAANDEVITLSHSAGSKAIFANGAVRAAKYIYDKAPGLYDMTKLINFE